MPLLSESILVSTESLNSDDHYAIVESNIDCINQLLGRMVDYAEITPEALKSYYVDYYLAQVKNGGFAQFVYNIGCDGQVIELVEEGLADMQATRNAAIFAKSLKIIDDMSEDDLDQFLDGEFFGEDAQRDALNANNTEFYELNKNEEDLVEVNSRWLKAHPLLKALDAPALEKELTAIAAKIPNLAEREEEAREGSPRYVKIIEALCEKTGQQLDRITAGDPTQNYQGKPVLAWHFLTDAGHFYMIDLGDKAIMFNGDSHTQVAELDVSYLEPEAGDEL